MKQSIPLLLDGSMGQEIVNRGGKSTYGEWGVAALHENPEIITAIHLDYLQAGADVITTNTYSTTRTRLRARGIEDRLEELVHIAGSLALDARTQAQSRRPNVQIAGSLGPLEASYINEFDLSYDEMVTQFSELMTLLAPYVDIYLGETFSTSLEARAFLTAAKDHNKTTWLSWTLEDHGSTDLRGGESLVDAIQTIQAMNPDAILVNCCTPDSIGDSLATLRDTNIPFGGYANGFKEVSTEAWNPRTTTDGQVEHNQELTPETYASHVENWIQAGASIVGGCCDIGPKHITKLRESLDGASST